MHEPGARGQGASEREGEHVKIALLGATGTIGSRIANEALSRGHGVTAIVRDAGKLVDKRMNPVIGDATSADSLVRAVKGHDAVVSAIGPGHGSQPSVLTDAARTLIEA